MWLSICFLILFLTVASTDGLYFHLYKYRLYALPASRYEHLLHTINSGLLPPQVYLMFCVRPAGAWLWVTLGLTLFSFAIEILDVLGEKDSRAALGGLSPAESAMHFFMGVMRSAYVMVFFAGMTAVDFTGAAALSTVELIPRMIGYCVIVPAVCIAVFHWLLLWTGRPLPAREPVEIL